MLQISYLVLTFVSYKTFFSILTQIDQAHIAYACVGIFSTFFSLLSLFVKERLYIGEATVAAIAGLILGPHCLGWFDPVTWGNTDKITLEISRIVLCVQIVAVAVELPRKYMKKHWVSVAIFLLPVMTFGWLVVGLFVWALIPHLNFPSALLVSACVTATDPVLAAAVVGKGKFAERVPGHLRNLLTAESGCNDGMAFPFIFLSLNLTLYPGQAGRIVKDWITLTILYECFFGVILGVTIGFTLKRAVAFAEKKSLIDRESFLAFFIFIAFNSAGLGSMLGVDDLLVSFAAGTAFGWNGEFAKKTEESHVSTVIDLIINLAFFVYFGAIIPWPQFNNADIGLNAWRLVVLAIVIIFLRRVPAVLALKPFTPDVKTWREALFCGHFGPIGVGAIFAAILARGDVEAHYTHEETPIDLSDLSPTHPHYQLLEIIWPVVCFVVIVSIIVHGSSVAVLTLGKRLNRMAITMTFTATSTKDQGPSWMNRLQKLDKASTSFSLHRIDTAVPGDEEMERSNTIETSGVKVRPAGGAKRKRHKKKRRGAASNLKKTLSMANSESDAASMNQRQRPHTEFLQLGRSTSNAPPDESIPVLEESLNSPETESPQTGIDEKDNDSVPSLEVENTGEKIAIAVPHGSQQDAEADKVDHRTTERKQSVATVAYQEGNKIVIEDENGEVVETLPMKGNKAIAKAARGEDNMSIHSAESLRRQMTQYSTASNSSNQSRTQTLEERLSKVPSRRRAFYKKGDPGQRKVYAHQVDNLIIIENEDGDIVRRYRVNKHSTNRERSGSLMNRALSKVGIRSRQGSTSAPEPVLTQVHDSTKPNSPLRDSKLETKIENQLVDIFTKKKGPGQPKGQAAIQRKRLPPPAVAEATDEDEDQEDYDHDSEDDDASVDSEEDEILQESNVERQRRLAALGRIPDKRDRDDEEE